MSIKFQVRFRFRFRLCLGFGLGYSNSVLFQEQYTNFYSVFTHHIQFSTLFLTTEKLQKKQYTNFTPDLTSIYKFTPCFDPQKIMKINEILYTIFTTVLNFQYTNGSAVLVVKSIHWIIQNYTHSFWENLLLYTANFVYKSVSNFVQISRGQIKEEICIHERSTQR